MIIDKTTHLRLEGHSFEYTVESMRKLVNNLRLQDLDVMERGVINYCRDEVKKTHPWIVNEAAIIPTFTTAEKAWSPAEPHNGALRVIIGNPGVAANFDP
jgi:hypothetical protein